MELHGKVALVTGGGAGIGEAIAMRLASEGATVVVVDQVEESARAVAERIEGEGGRSLALRADVAVPSDITAIVDAATATFGGVDVLVNNAGNADVEPFPDVPPEAWARTIDVNLRAPMLAIQAALPSMRERGGGAVVNIASIAGLGLEPHDTPEYAAAKAGLIRLTATLAGLARDGIRVNCVCPDWVDTPNSRETRAAMSEEALATVPPVLLQPEKIADVVAGFVADDTMAGRVVEYWCGQPPRLIPVRA